MVPNFIRSCLVKLGSRCGEKIVHYMNSFVNYVEAGQWMSSHGSHTGNRWLKSREELFRLVASEVADKKVLYLEFGVWFGASIRHWTALLKNPESHLDGFDTFEGLPLNWKPLHPKGAYSAGGAVPKLTDPRVKFYKGLFQETLPSYVPSDHEVLILNIDCDSYASAAFVLNTLRAYIVPGAYVYFDEFCDRSSELKAFDDFVTLTGKRFRLVGASRELCHVCFQCIV